MLRRCICLLLFLTAPVAAQQAYHPYHRPVPALALFEKDWVLMNWALKYYDRDRDVLLSPQESGAAAADFRNMADANHDGRVSVEEYRAARSAILERY